MSEQSCGDQKAEAEDRRARHRQRHYFRVEAMVVKIEKRNLGTEFKASESLNQAAYETLFNQIMDRTLVGGAVIQERKMADAFGISRTPMRKALARLEGEGLLIRLTDRLLSVKIVTLPECIDAMSVRKIIEPEAIRLATPRITKSVLDDLKSQLMEIVEAKEPSVVMHWTFDDNLHGTIAKYSGNLAMIETVARLRRTTRMFEQMEVPEPTLSPGTDEHLRILEEMEGGDPDKAAEAMYLHLVKSCDGILDQL